MPEEGRPQRNPLDLTWLVSYKIQNIRLERNKELIDPNTLDRQMETVQGAKRVVLDDPKEECESRTLVSKAPFTRSQRSLVHN